MSLNSNTKKLLFKVLIHGAIAGTILFSSIFFTVQRQNRQIQESKIEMMILETKLNVIFLQVNTLQDLFYSLDSSINEISNNVYNLTSKPNISIKSEPTNEKIDLLVIQTGLIKTQLDLISNQIKYLRDYKIGVKPQSDKNE